MIPAYPDVLIAGCGFTGARAMQLLRAKGIAVEGLRRSEGFDCTRPDSLQTLAGKVGPATRVLLSIPTQRDAVGGLFECTPALVQAVRHAARIVYLSTTGVYGAQTEVDRTTPVQPRTERELLRVEAEQAVLAHPNAMVLRPAAIYGPGRGVHVALREGRFALAEGGSNFTSRIHVDDLAALTSAALLSDVQGAWPVADTMPSTAREIAEFCATLMNLTLPPATDAGSLPETRRTNRRVDGSAIREVLGVTLRYPSYREGIPACIAEESHDPA